MDLTKQVILITGASKGIGRATAVELAKKGASVIINYANDENSATKVLKEVNKHSSGNLIAKANITKENEIKDMFETIRKECGRLDALVNNAGIYDGSNDPTDEKVLENIYNTNFAGQVRVIKYALKIMKEGKIVNVSSIHGRLGRGHPEAIFYSALKAALENYTKNLAKTLAPKIIVNAVAPGRTLTPQWGKMSEKEIRDIGAGQLINRFITPEEVADAIAFLLENDAMCGEVLTIDGGFSLKTT